MSTHYVRESRNSKLGPMSATYRTQDTCPTDCPLMGSGCYAETGPAGRSAFTHANKLGTDDLRKLADRAIAETPWKGLLRFEVSGDVTGPDDPWITETNRIAAERPDVRFIRYTHAWRNLSPALFAYPVNASCETADDVREATAAGWETVIVADGPADALIGQTIAGRRVAVCPNQSHTGPAPAPTCRDCRLCSRSRSVTVAFIPHGARRKLVASIVTERRTGQ